MNVIKFIATDQIVNCTESDFVMKLTNSNRNTTEKWKITFSWGETQHTDL